MPLTVPMIGVCPRITSPFCGAKRPWLLGMKLRKRGVGVTVGEGEAKTNSGESGWLVPSKVGKGVIVGGGSHNVKVRVRVIPL